MITTTNESAAAQFSGNLLYLPGMSNKPFSLVKYMTSFDADILETIQTEYITVINIIRLS
jgi:hypothetical protein